MAEKRPSKKILPEDAEAYVALAREKASPSGKIMQRVQAVNQSRLENLTTELEVAQVEQALKSVKGISPAQTENLAAMIFKGKTAEEIKEILENLTPEALVKLTQLSKATDPVAMALTQPHQPAAATGQSRDELLIKLLFEERSKSTDNLIAMVKLMKELQPAPAPPQPTITPDTIRAIVREVTGQQGSGGIAQTLETIKVVGELNKPFYEVISKKDKELMDMKLKEIKDNMPQDPIETIKYVKEMSGALGLGSQKNEIDLRLEEMRQNKDVDMARLNWEMEQKKMDRESDNQKYEFLTGILSGPIGQAISNVGSAGADRVRGKLNPNRPPNPVQTQCPNCSAQIYVDANADTAVCGSCGASLQRGGQTPPAPQPAPQETTRVEHQAPQETEIESEENEPVETESETEPEESEPEQPAA